MKEENIELIPITEVSIPNPRPRNKLQFQSIVVNIDTVGLKKPITVSRRELAPDGTRYDLVCGQGRLEALAALGQQHIPAIITEASREQQFLMSLVENIARRPPSNLDLLREIRVLKARGYKTPEIATKLGLAKTYIHGIVKLVENGEENLIKAVEARRLPISVAVTISSGSSEEVQKALTEAYEKGDLRGTKLAAARRIIERRLAKKNKSKDAKPENKLSANVLVQTYRRHVESNRALLKKAAITNDRLTILTSIIRRLFGDEDFVTLLRAESLLTMPEYLTTCIK
jgi:ParB family transcriptional regulator, chromosome partitioning protein